MKIEKPIEILVHRIASLGDVVYTTGVIRELKHKYGDTARITMQTDYTDVYANNPHVYKVLPSSASLDLATYDIFYNLNDCYEYNPANHYVDSYFHRVFGDNDLDHSPELHVSESEAAEVDEDLAFIGDKFIAVHMRQWHWELKNIKPDVWYKIFEDIFAERTDHKIVFVGGDSDNGGLEHPLMVDVTGRYTPAQLGYLLDHAACFVGIDSGPYAIATASKCPIVALLSHMPPSTIIPIRDNTKGKDSTVIQADVSCVGCYERQERPVRKIVCERNDFACNTLWKTEQVSQAILGYMK
jgi:ADP-heptose:LPS heptosyltransferase